MEKTPYVGPFLRIIASVYDFFLLLGVWFLVGSLALWLNGGEILNPALGSLLVFLSGWAFYAFFWMKNGVEGRLRFPVCNPITSLGTSFGDISSLADMSHRR